MNKKAGKRKSRSRNIYSIVVLNSICFFFYCSVIIGVIVFGSDQEVKGLMEGVKRNNATSIFQWIGSDGWSARSLVTDGNEHQIEGTISVQPMAKSVSGFDEYFLNLKPAQNNRNPWFIEYWEHIFKCKWNNSNITPYNQHYNR